MKQLSHASCVVYVTKLWHRQTRLHNPCNCLCQDVILGGCWRDPRSPILLISLHTKVTLPALLSTPKLLHIVHAFPRLGYHAELKFDSLLWYALSSSSSFNVMRTQSPTDHTLFTALRQCWTVPSYQNDIWLYGCFVYIYIHPLTECPSWLQLLIMLIHCSPWFLFATSFLPATSRDDGSRSR